MKFRKFALAAVAAVVFCSSAVAGVWPGPCQVCRNAYQACQLDPAAECESEFSRCLIQAGCPLE
ncbi:hypothetical protein GLA29479_1849 [Lysobacter antibioticus]|jgi:hypothetical protein|uniref:Lipoprotein n=1 Tax=Lysobacter antibioticus TaxID=84531 RepID=A0A0S2FBI2_LYSAN|nr:hypothetical protein [Lysobacter antibioticus]ALN62723.1 hypothetical protein GLA29479_1849 [Lysobacter antibioticus]ALN80911.1 hypothetical protein LA76x_2781 [Lysobacter antibioticus]